jgi:EAL domain-containing protein (putative c-di-GMP-specific phosphodiesterase class I)/GGDEF domain-containing protein
VVLEPPALLVRFAADGSVAEPAPVALSAAEGARWSPRHLDALAERWPSFGPAALDGADRTFVWMLGDRWLVTAVSRAEAVDARGVVVVVVDTATVDVTELRAGRSDPLTGLATRDVLVERAEAVIRSLRHDPSPAGVAVVALGTDVPPAAVVEAAERLEATVRGGDVVGRAGPDSLAVVFGTTISETEARVAAARMVRELAAHPDVHVGLAFADSPVSAAGLLDEADAAVDLARGAGTRIYVVDDHDRGALEWTTRRVDELRLAVDLDQFEVAYQPVVRLADGVVGSFEALVRWQHPTEGVLPPDEFVPLAERTGLIEGVTARVLDHVLDLVATIHRVDALRTPVVAVNVAATDLLRIGFVDELVGGLERRSVPPETMRLELTERSVLADLPRAVEVISALRDAGIGVSLDDFGTGASTLAVLRDLPVDCLKIDRSFVVGLPDSGDDRAVVALVVGLARHLGVAVVAEGIESEGQREALSELGCEWGQGYLFGPAWTTAQMQPGRPAGAG